MVKTTYQRGACKQRYRGIGLQMDSQITQENCQKCVICATNNVGSGIQTPQSAHPAPNEPFADGFY